MFRNIKIKIRLLRYRILHFTTSALKLLVIFKVIGMSWLETVIVPDKLSLELAFNTKPLFSKILYSPFSSPFKSDFTFKSITLNVFKLLVVIVALEINKPTPLLTLTNLFSTSAFIGI